MAPFRRTALASLLGAFLLWLVLTVAGVLFIKSHDNAFAREILAGHRGAIASVYLRLLLGYLAGGLAAALFLHPLLPGWRALPATLVLAVLGLTYTLTDGTQLLHGPTQTLFCTIHDLFPSWVHAIYRPVGIVILLGGLALWSLARWAKKIPGPLKIAALAVVLGLVALRHLPAVSAAPMERTCFLLIATDSLRADHLSCNGYPRPTTPHIDALARDGVNFANCLVPTASTHESWVTTFAGREPRDHGLRHMFPSRELVARIERTEAFLPRMLAAQGYATAAIGGWCGTTFGLFDMGFEHVDVSNTQNHVALIAEAAFTNHLPAAAFLDNAFGRLLLPELDRVSFTRGATAITRKAERWLEDAARDARPFFLVLKYHVTHLPYSASYPYYAMFTDPEYRGRNRYRIDFKIDEMIQRGFDHDLTDAERRHLVDLYDGCTREFDDQVGALVDVLQRLGLADRTVVGVMADHGDDLYEHGTTLGHGVTLFGGDQANRIPAVFRGPGIPPRRVDKLVRSFDLTPTWAGWLGLGKDAQWTGTDLRGEIPDLTARLETSYLLYRQPVPDLEPGERVKGFPKFDSATFLDPDFDHNIVLREEFADALLETKCFAVREGSWKYIRVPGEGGPIERLFDLSTDPHCERNLARAQPDVVERLRARLDP